MDIIKIYKVSGISEEVTERKLPNFQNQGGPPLFVLKKLILFFKNLKLKININFYKFQNKK